MRCHSCHVHTRYEQPVRHSVLYARSTVFKKSPSLSPHSSHGDGGKGCLQLLSWNIDGLDRRNLQERTNAVCDFIMDRKPHVVYLQEVVPPTRVTIVGRLNDAYDCFSVVNPPAHYYPAILVRKSSMEVHSGLEYNVFPTTIMGRHLLKLVVKFCGLEIHLMTSHLESMKDNAAERKKQLREAFGIMAELQKTKKAISVFGGDLNVEGNEVNSVGLPENTVDLWQACGSDKEHQFTWDVSENDNLDWPYPNKPRLRFDRLYLCPSDGALRPKSFSLVGKERLASCGRFPSDHWGLWTELEVM